MPEDRGPRFTSSYDIPSSIEKEFHYVEAVAKYPFTVKFSYRGKDIVQNATPPSRIVVSDNLFRSYDCLALNCSHCCWKVRFHNIYTEQQYNNLTDTYKEEKYEPEVTLASINDKSIKLYSEEHTEKDCPHLDYTRNLCRVHLQNPITCAFPLIKFKRVKDVVYLTREYYGRNWFMKCPAKFGPMTEQGYNFTIYLLNRLRSMCEEIAVEHNLDSIISKVESRYSDTQNTQLTLLEDICSAK